MEKSEEPIMMHSYRCPLCNFAWRQERKFSPENCIRCGKVGVEYLGADWWLPRGLVVPHVVETEE